MTPAALTYPKTLGRDEAGVRPMSLRRRARVWHMLRPVAAYGAAVSFVGISFVLTFLLQRFFPYPFLFFFFGAVVASAWFSGTGPGFLSVVLSTVLVDYFFVPPFNSFSITPSAEAYFGAFVVCALIATWVSS